MVSKSTDGNSGEIADENTIINQESCEITWEHDDTDLNMSGSSSLPSVGKKKKYDHSSDISLGFTKVGCADACDAQSVVCHKILYDSKGSTN